MLARERGDPAPAVHLWPDLELARDGARCPGRQHRSQRPRHENGHHLPRLPPGAGRGPAGGRHLGVTVVALRESEDISQRRVDRLQEGLQHEHAARLARIQARVRGRAQEPSEPPVSSSTYTRVVEKK